MPIGGKVKAWGVVTKDTGDYWANRSGNYIGRLSIYDTRENARKDAGAIDKVIRITIEQLTK
jgi:hypothetical protein